MASVERPAPPLVGRLEVQNIYLFWSCLACGYVKILQPVAICSYFRNTPGVFLNASLCVFFSRTERKKKLKKVQLSEKKRLTSGAFLTADQSQFEIAHHRNEAPGL